MAADPAASEAIAGLLAAHAGEPMDFVAIFMFLNTALGGHFQEQFTEEAIRAALDELQAEGRVETVTGDLGSYFRLVH